LKQASSRWDNRLSANAGSLTQRAFAVVADGCWRSRTLVAVCRCVQRLRAQRSARRKSGAAFLPACGAHLPARAHLGLRTDSAADARLHSSAAGFPTFCLVWAFCGSPFFSTVCRSVYVGERFDTTTTRWRFGVLVVLLPFYRTVGVGLVTRTLPPAIPAAGSLKFCSVSSPDSPYPTTHPLYCCAVPARL
jgi:hypothetical protein